ncbi:MAG TPA: acyl-ACP--UDP-N-acetylglucosamine O-acyltransferase [Gammaproteobacteria bacterium]|nr:acyl-ACP--UDP-N-acetylglucosamine O-acyltransferase [Gammaproteobacteria bacterium]
MIDEMELGAISAVIHETAVIHPSCKVGKNVSIGPYVCVGPNVEIGEGCVIHAHGLIHKNTTLGNQNTIHSFASIGGDAQFQGEHDAASGQLIIGDRNIFHEYCTVNRGHDELSGVTQIGHDNYFMTSAHVGHDCVIGDGVCLVNGATLAGSVIVEDKVTLSANVRVHQFCCLGRLSFIAVSAVITLDVAPFVLVASKGETTKTFGLNKVGLQRAGMSADDLSFLKKAYRILFRNNESMGSSLVLLEGFNHPLGKELKGFIEEKSKRGLLR